MTGSASSRSVFLLGNEALARSALEGGVCYATGYPGTPSSEIIQALAKEAKEYGLHVEWSANEKVAVEGAAAAAVAGLKSLSAMKNAGLSVALDFLTHLSMTGLGNRRGAMVVIVCDDPDGHSSGDETDSRWLARFAYMPLLEPTSIPEAKELLQWAFDLSSEFACQVMLRSYTRLSHSSSLVELGPVEPKPVKAWTDSRITLNPYLAKPKHAKVVERLKKIEARFEKSPFNQYFGPEEAEIVIVCGGSGFFCAQDAVDRLGAGQSVGLLKLATLWPFPKKGVARDLARARKVLVAEEVDPFIEVHVKSVLSQAGLADKPVFGRESGHIEPYGEITPDRVAEALASLLGRDYLPRPAEYETKVAQQTAGLLSERGVSWCPGCPHRASFWALGKAMKADGRQAYLTGDIGCYTLDVFPGGKEQMNILQAMGSGTGLASGLGQLGRFGYTQPVVSVCGDSTFFHATIPALINAVHNQANMLQVILDNGATAMTGFQSHPGTATNAIGEPAGQVDLEKLCRSLGCQVSRADPFELKATIKTIRQLLKQDQGVRVLILRRDCELVRMRREKKKPFEMSLDQSKCRADKCGVCLSQLRCPGLVRNPKDGLIEIRAESCAGCGFCFEICPFGAIGRREVA